jgi:hypothetical protein
LRITSAWWFVKASNIQVIASKCFNFSLYKFNGTQCNQLLTIIKDTFLDQVVQEPTRVTETTASVLDVFVTNNSTLTNKVEVIPGISDHEAVFIESSLRLAVGILVMKEYSLSRY